MPRKPEVSLGLGLATATLVWTIYNHGLPGQADIRVGEPGNETIETVRKQNSWMAAGTVAGISLLSKDATVFILGGAMVIALDWLTRVNNFTNPVTGSAIGNPFAAQVTPVRATGGEPSAATYADAMSVA
jgi:hypothetical protein